MDVSDDDSEFVPGVEEVDPEEFDNKGKKRKTEEIARLEENELEAMWAEMNGGVKVAKKEEEKKELKVEAKKEQEVSHFFLLIDSGCLTYRFQKIKIDVSKLLGEIKEVDKPKMETEKVKYAGVDVEVGKTSSQRLLYAIHILYERIVVAVPEKNKKKDNVASIIEQLKGGKIKKINTIEKSQLDWDAHKATDKTVNEELNKHMKGGTYLEKVAFLKRTERREYEKERENKK